MGVTLQDIRIPSGAKATASLFAIQFRRFDQPQSEPQSIVCWVRPAQQAGEGSRRPLFSAVREGYAEVARVTAAGSVRFYFRTKDTLMLLSRSLSLAAFGLGFVASILSAAPPATATDPAVKSKRSAAAVPSATVAADRKGAWWVLRHTSINAWAERGPVDLLFLGDSITQGWGKIVPPKRASDPHAKEPEDLYETFEGNAAWQKFYASRRPLNAGIGGDTTQTVLWRLDHGLLDSLIDEHKPKLVVLMIGTNNSGPRGNTGEEIGAGIVAVVRKLREKLPQTKVLVLGIFPRAKDDPAVSTDLPVEKRAKRGKLGKQNDKLVVANAIAAEAADGQMVHYLDIGKKFLDQDGMLPDDIMPDFLHLSPKGYEIWATAIEAKVVQLLGEKK